MRIVEIGNAVLIRGDSLDVLPTLGRFDALITDPPYGVGFTGKETKYGKQRPARLYRDDEETFRAVVLPIVRQALGQCERAAIFTGTRRLQEYPTASDIGGIFAPAGQGRTRWGFGCFQPVAFFGKSPYMARGLGGRPTATAIKSVGKSLDLTHPCPKPLEYMRWAIKAASFEGETVLDPFMGSGTTAIAALEAGRRFVGIELDPVFFKEAVVRVRRAFKDLQSAERTIEAPQRKGLANGKSPRARIAGARADAHGCTDVGGVVRPRRKIRGDAARLPLRPRTLRRVVRAA